MAMTDPIADLLTRIRNGQQARHDKVSVPGSKIKARIVEILKDEGFIADFSVVERQPQSVIEVTLKYGSDQRGAIVGIQRESKPGRRVYVGADAIPRIRNGLGVAILSTSKGLLPDHAARKRRIGGEFLCSIW